MKRKPRWMEERSAEIGVLLRELWVSSIESPHFWRGGVTGSETKPDISGRGLGDLFVTVTHI